MSVTVSGALGLRLGHKESKPVSDPKEALVLLNQQPVSRADVAMLYPVYRGVIAGRLVIERLLEKAAGKERGRVASGSPSTSTRLDQNPIFQRLALKDWPDSRLRRFYSLYQEELAHYQLSCLPLRKQDRSAVEEDLQREVDFDSLVARYAIDEGNKPQVWQKTYSKTELEEDYGRQIAQSLLGLGAGRSIVLDGPGHKPYLYRLTPLPNSFQDLKPLLKLRVVEARGPSLVNELLSRAKIYVSGPLGTDPQILEYEI